MTYRAMITSSLLYRTVHVLLQATRPNNSRDHTDRCRQFPEFRPAHKHVSFIHSFFIFVLYFRLTKELVEAKKKMDDKSITADKKTFLKAQMPKLEAEIKIEREEVLGLLDEDELDPRGEFFVMAKKLTKKPK